MDTDHPAFQQPPPEYIDPPEDVFVEQLVEHGATLRISFSPSQLRLIQGHLKSYQPETATSSSATGSLVALLAYIVDSATPLAELDAVAYCYGLLGRGEESMDSIAKRHSISRQAFSKKVQHTQDRFSIQPRGGMRPISQRQTYRRVHHARWEYIEQDAPKLTTTKP